MDRSSIIDMMQSRITTPADFNYDKLQGPPILALVSAQDVQDLHYIATSVKYSGNPRKKYKAIDSIMKARGFSKLGAGTNRVVYRFLEDDRFVFKIAVDDVGMKDNPREFQNQIVLKPFCAKTFEIDPTGTIACSERVRPITNREEFEAVASDVYEMLTTYIIGKYIMADIGSHYFLNYGIRNGFGCVLLDYTYLYELDGNKLHCTEPDPFDPSKQCNGIIDYDAGFNKLYCQKCGKWYRVQELAKIPEFKDIINRRSENKMDVIIRRGNDIIQHVGETKEDAPFKSTTKFEKPTEKIEYSNSIKVKITRKPVQKHVSKNPQTHYQQRSETPKFETKSDGEFKLKNNRDTGVQQHNNTKPVYNKPNTNNIQRGVVRTASEPVKADNIFNPDVQSKTKTPHFKRVSFNAKFETLTVQDDKNNRFVIELKEHPDIIQQIVEGSEYFKNILSMKQSAFDSLKKNNTDLNDQIEKLTEENKTLHEKVESADDKKEESYQNAQNRIKELEQQILDMKEKETKVPQYGKEEEEFQYSKYPNVMFTNGEVTTLKKIGKAKDDADDHKILILSDGDIDNAAADADGNMVAIATINGILVDKFDQLKESELITNKEEDDEN